MFRLWPKKHLTNRVTFCYNVKLSCILEGYYLYTAASVRYANQTGRLKSISIHPNGKAQCLSFWYHMYGPNIGGLNLYVQSRPSLGTPLWKRSGSQGNQWKQATVTLPSTGTYNVSI